MRDKLPFLSIVIPYHNDINSIDKLLQSIVDSRQPPAHEVIIVDDGSEEKFNLTSSLRAQAKQSIKIAKRLPRFAKGGTRNDIIVRVIHLPKNKGPAAARNRGVREARGKFILFLDSDVELYSDALQNLARIYQEDPDIVAVTGVWVKYQKSQAFFPNFKALRDWSYWINERDKSGYYFLFSTRIASIKKSVFQRLGGFDETYPGALVEDIELTYRIARRYAIIFAPNVRVRHEFESFWPIAKKYFLRAYYWTKLYARRKKFDPVATTWWEALTTVTGVGVVFLTPISLIGQIGQIGLIVIFLLHLFLVRKFLVFLYREKGFVFALKGFFVGLILYCFIFAGALWGKVRLSLGF